jgi:quercetin dioxygenase-like cupin family protein
MHFGEQELTLNPGDSVYYESTEPHSFVAQGDLPARALAVLFSHDI